MVSLTAKAEDSDEESESEVTQKKKKGKGKKGKKVRHMWLGRGHLGSLILIPNFSVGGCVGLRIQK